MPQCQGRALVTRRRHRPLGTGARTRPDERDEHAPAPPCLPLALAIAPELHVRLIAHAAFYAADALQIFHLIEDSACEVTPSQAFELIGVDPQDLEEAFRSALAVELLGLSA